MWLLTSPEAWPFVILPAALLLFIGVGVWGAWLAEKRRRLPVDPALRLTSELDENGGPVWTGVRGDVRVRVLTGARVTVELGAAVKGTRGLVVDDTPRLSGVERLQPPSSWGGGFTAHWTSSPAGAARFLASVPAPDWRIELFSFRLENGELTGVFRTPFRRLERPVLVKALSEFQSFRSALERSAANC